MLTNDSTVPDDFESHLIERFDLLTSVCGYLSIVPGEGSRSAGGILEMPPGTTQ